MSSNVRQFRSKEQRMQEAGDWVARLDRGLNVEEEALLDQWLRADAANRRTLDYMLKVWDKAESLKRLAALFPTPIRRRDRIRPYALTAVAASAVLVAALFWADVYRPGITPEDEAAIETDVTSEIYETAVGERKKVWLADGSSVFLNTNSLIEVRIDDQQRELILHQGEAIFGVAHDPERAFSVSAGDGIFTAVGTEFNLEMMNHHHVELVVTDGEVLVGVKTGSTVSSARAAPGSYPRPSVVVSAGQQYIVGESDRQVVQIEPADIEVRLSWRQGNLVFRGESLEEAVREISRYATVQFVFVDEDLRNERVGGLFKAGDVDGMLETLQNNFDIEYERVGDNRVLLRRH